MKIQAHFLDAYSRNNKFSKNSVLKVEIFLSQFEQSEIEFKELFNELNLIKPNLISEWEDELPTLLASKTKMTVVEALVYLSIIFQRWMGYPVNCYKILGSGRIVNNMQRFECIFEFMQKSSALSSFNLSMSVIKIWLNNPVKTSFEKIPVLESFLKQLSDSRPKQINFIREAERREIPWRNLSDNDNFIEVGAGFKKRRVFRHFSDKTGFIATQISSNKSITNQFFLSNGIPVPKHKIVLTEHEAVQVFQLFASKVVVKPVSTDRGLAVYPDLDNELEVVKAFRNARKYGQVLVEEYIKGTHHRLMIIDGRFISARCQIPAHVVGDAAQTVEELIQNTNKIRSENGWKLIPSDEEAFELLRKQGLTFESIPELGRRVNLRLQGNLSTGGSMEVVTDKVHPDNQKMVIRAVKLLNIDIAGVDYITTDISKPYYETGGQICEINVTPGFIFDEYKELFNSWFPEQKSGRIPVVVIIDGEEKLGVAIQRKIQSLIKKPVTYVGFNSIHLDDDIIHYDFKDRQKAIETALFEPSAYSAVIKIKSKDVLEKGINLKFIDILCVFEREELISVQQEVLSLLSGLSSKVIRFKTFESGVAEITESLNVFSERLSEFRIDEVYK